MGRFLAQYISTHEVEHMKLLSYPGIGRIPMHLIDEEHFTVRGKNYLTLEETSRLLGEGVKHIQEKVDGKPFSKVDGNAQLFFEDMEYQHTVPYKTLPRKQLLLDVWHMIEDRWATVESHKLRPRRDTW